MDLDVSPASSALAGGPISHVSSSGGPILARPAVLLNANAKRVNPELLRRFRRVLPAEDVYVSGDLSTAEAHVGRILERGYRRLLIGGGDGTIASTLGLLHRVGGARRPLGPVPDLGILRLGTGNALASWVGAGRPLSDAERVVAGEALRTRSLRVLQDEHRGRVFAFGSLGYDAQLLNDYVDVLSACRSAYQRRWHKSLVGYVYALLTRTLPKELFRRPTGIRVSSLGKASVLDPRTSEEIPLAPGSVLFAGPARAVVFGSSPNYGYGVRVLPYAQRRPDRFHLRVSTASIPYLLRHLPQLWRGTLRSEHAIDFLVEDVRVETEQPWPLQYSGDPEGQVTDLRVRLSERRFRLLEMSQLSALKGTRALRGAMRLPT